MNIYDNYNLVVHAILLALASLIIPISVGRLVACTVAFYVLTSINPETESSCNIQTNKIIHMVIHKYKIKNIFT